MKTLLLFIALISFSFSLSAYAYRVTPMTAEFDSKGRMATQTFQIENNSEKTIALEVETKTRKIDINNKETRESTKNFMIYPLQLSVKPQEKKNVRVTYVGPEVENEEAYRLIVRQLPVDLEKKKEGPGVRTQINFLFEYVASLYVKAKSAPNYKIEIQNYKREGNMARLTLKNVGNTHILFKSFNVVVKSGEVKEELNLGQNEFENVGSYNLLPGDIRKIDLPLPAKIKGNELSFEFKVREIF